MFAGQLTVDEVRQLIGQLVQEGKALHAADPNLGPFPVADNEIAEIPVATDACAAAAGADPEQARACQIFLLESYIHAERGQWGDCIMKLRHPHT